MYGSVSVHMDEGDRYWKMESAAPTTSMLQPHWGQNFTGTLSVCCRMFFLAGTRVTMFSDGLCRETEVDLPCAMLRWRLKSASVMNGTPCRDFHAEQISQVNTLSGFGSVFIPSGCLLSIWCCKLFRVKGLPLLLWPSSQYGQVNPEVFVFRCCAIICRGGMWIVTEGLYA